MSETFIHQLANELGGKIEVCQKLLDGSGFAVMAFPLPSDHWLTCEGTDVPPMPFRIGTNEDGMNVLPRIRTRDEFAEKIRAAGRYAMRATTENGKVTDFDPDAFLQNLVIGMLGFWTPDGQMPP